MAQKPDGKSAKTDRVTFTRPAAERIASVVRKVEAGNRDSAPLVFNRAGVGGGGGGTVFRMCTFTGAWSKGTQKGVTFRNVTTTPNTAAAYNLFGSVNAGGQTGNGAIARDGTAWYLIAAEC